MIDQNVIAGVLEHIAKGLREGSFEVVEVHQEQQFHHDDLRGYSPTGHFSLALNYARKGVANG